MNLDNSLNEALKTIISPTLRGYGFKRQGFIFYCIKNDNWGLISFQKSMHQIPGATRFTINVGVVSARLLKFFSGSLKKKTPVITDCHWRIRLGRLTHGQDMWWSMEDSKPIEELSKYLLHAIEKLAIPEIHKYLDDEALRDLWLSSDTSNLTDFQRFLYLSVLLKEIGPIDLLNSTLERLKRISRDSPSAITADIYIEKLLEH